jgi:2-methylcitrate dehydratase PrpD
MGTATAGLADRLARWATELDPTEDDLALARRSLLDTLGVMFAARGDPLAPLFARLSGAGRWAALAHVLDYDDLHLPSTTHIGAVCVPVALAASGEAPGAGDADAARAYLAGAGATADPRTLEDWIALVGGDPSDLVLDGPAVPGGLAIKPFPCCYALQRPIAAVRTLETKVATADIRRITVRTPAASLAPLIHHDPATGLEGKFSLEYGIAAALLDGDPGFDSFSDAAVQRPEAVRVARLVRAAASDDGGDHLLTGEVEIEIDTTDGAGVRAVLALPPGAPERPMTDEQLRAKLALCGATELAALTWESAARWARSL